MEFFPPVSIPAASPLICFETLDDGVLSVKPDGLDPRAVVRHAIFIIHASSRKVHADVHAMCTTLHGFIYQFAQWAEGTVITGYVQFDTAHTRHTLKALLPDAYWDSASPVCAENISYCTNPETRDSDIYFSNIEWVLSAQTVTIEDPYPI